MAYVSPDEPVFQESVIPSQEMPLENLWVLEEGHCLRNQVFNFCNHQVHQSSVYEAGSIDTLVKIVDVNGGYTIIPELHVDLLSEKQKANLRDLVEPEAIREISLVVRHDYVREGMMNAVAESVKKLFGAYVRCQVKKFAIKL